MSLLDKTSFGEKFINALTGLFRTGQTRGIGSDDLRTLVEDIRDSFSDGVDWKKFVLAATTTTLPAYTASGGGTVLTANANGVFPTIDTVTLVANDDVLVKDEGTQKYNGIYKLTQVGSGGTPWILTRRIDGTTGEQIQNAIVPVQKGSTNLGTIWKQSNSSAVTIDTTSITFSRQSPPVYITALETNSEGSTISPPVSTLVGTFVQTTQLGSGSVLTGDANVTPTPAAGYLAVPIMFFVNLDYNSVAYSGNTTFRFEINGVPVTATNTTILPGTADRFTTILPIAFDTTAVLTGHPIKWEVQGGAPSSGNSPLTIVCVYRIVLTGNPA